MGHFPYKWDAFDEVDPGNDRNHRRIERNDVSFSLGLHSCYLANNMEYCYLVDLDKGGICHRHVTLVICGRVALYKTSEMRALAPADYDSEDEDWDYGLDSDYDSDSDYKLRSRSNVDGQSKQNTSCPAESHQKNRTERVDTPSSHHRSMIKRRSSPLLL